jgi:hypothetical protein
VKVWVVTWYERRDSEPLIEVYATEALAEEEKASHPRDWSTTVDEREVLGS